MSVRKRRTKKNPPHPIAQYPGTGIGPWLLLPFDRSYRWFMVAQGRRSHGFLCFCAFCLNSFFCSSFFHLTFILESLADHPFSINCQHHTPSGTGTVRTNGNGLCAYRKYKQKNRTSHTKSKAQQDKGGKRMASEGGEWKRRKKSRNLSAAKNKVPIRNIKNRSQSIALLSHQCNERTPWK